MNGPFGGYCCGMTEGNVHQAGEGLSDEEMVEQVEESTSSDLQAESAFERESGGASDDREASRSPGLREQLQQERKDETHPR